MQPKQHVSKRIHAHVLKNVKIASGSKSTSKKPQITDLTTDKMHVWIQCYKSEKFRNSQIFLRFMLDIARTK